LSSSTKCLRAKADDPWEDNDVVLARENGQPLDPRADWQEWSERDPHAER
jgi:hypothetical protein